MTFRVKKNAVLEMKGIVKTFPGVKALQGVDFTLCKGEIHALMGENGAGKSTLIKVLTGVYEKDGGEIFLEGLEKAGNYPLPKPDRSRKYVHRAGQGCFDELEKDECGSR